MAENNPQAVDVELVWQSFHHAVNMTSQELRTWLLTEASGETALPADPGLDLPELGDRVVRILGKRKRDLDPGDIEAMTEVVDVVTELLEQRPDDPERDDDWRHHLMSVGHDPLKPDSPRDDLSLL